LHFSDSDKSDDEGAIGDLDAKQTAKEAKEAARKLQKETERLLRERRCIIPPAPVERRSMTSFVERLSAKVSNRGPTKQALSKMKYEDEHPMQPPSAPQDNEKSADSHPLGMGDTDEEDDDLDDLVIVSKPALVTKVQQPPPAKAVQQAQVTISKPKSAAAPVSLNPRQELRARLLKTALERSDHIGQLVAQKHSQAEPEPPKDPFPGNSSPFIASEKFVGSKAGYVFKMASKGLGYYVDKPASTDQSEAAMPELDETQKPSSADEGSSSLTLEDEGTQQMGGESQKLVLHYDEDTQTGFGGEESCAPCDAFFRSAAKIEANKDPKEAAGKQGQPKSEVAKRVYGRKANEAAQAARNAREGSSAHRRRSSDHGSDDDGYEVDEDESEDEADDDEEEQESMSMPKKADDSSKVNHESEDDEKDDDDEDEEDGDDDDDDDDEEEEEEEEDKVEAAPVKKSLADITSIKKQAALRLGTLEAGYLRNEEKVLGFHEDIEMAEEDLGEGIDLMDTDGEDAEEEEDEGSEAEREVAEGFIEDARFAGEDRDPSLLRDAHMQLQDEDEQKITERILDVVRGDARRRRVAQQEDGGWIPNKHARARNMYGEDGDEDGIDLQDMPAAGDDDDREESAAINAAILARQRIERMKFLQQKRAQEALDEEEAEAPDVQATTNAALARKASGPSLSAFARSISNVGMVRSISAGPNKSLVPGQRPFGCVQEPPSSSSL
jgi:hypothetical protein